MAEAFNVQLGIRQNAAELHDFLNDLNCWQDEVKSKDEDLRKSKVINKQNLPPVRNQAKKKKKKAKQSPPANSKDGGPKDGSRISSYDYRSWDKFDVDKVLEEMDVEEEMKTFSSSEEESEETDEDVENERRLQRALLEKDKGNALFKEGKYEEAINSYTSGIQLDPTNAILPANRAMCLLKLQRYGAAESDCNQALSIDGSYTKAYLRRAAARFQLYRLQEAEEDYQEVLRLEPSNKQAQEELRNINKLLGKNTATEPEGKIVEGDATEKLSRSKKPLRRIVIEEIGTESESEDEEATEVSTSAHVTTSSHTEDKRSGVNQAVLSTTLSNHSRDKSKGLDGKEGSPGKAQPLLTTQSQSLMPTPRSQSSCRTFTVPKTSAQFHSDWRTLQKQPEDLFQYLRKINPESYPKLFQQSIESDVVVGICQVLHDSYISNGLSVYKELKYLSQVKRFSMTVMFLSDSDKTVIQELFNYMRKNQETSNISDADILDLAKKYGVS